MSKKWKKKCEQILINKWKKKEEISNTAHWRITKFKCNVNGNKYVSLKNNEYRLKVKQVNLITYLNEVFSFSYNICIKAHVEIKRHLILFMRKLLKSLVWIYTLFNIYYIILSYILFGMKRKHLHFYRLSLFFLFLFF